MNSETIKKHGNAIVLGIVAILVVIFVCKWINRHRGLVTIPEKDQTYTVAIAPDQNESIRLLSEIKSRLRYLIDYCIKQYPHHENVQLLKQRFDPNNVQETSLYESGTSYTIDKGKELHLCLRNKTAQHPHHNINILMFVAIHELAHIMSVSYGHNSEFRNNFKFLLEKAVECNVYVAENYYVHPVQFCGLTVNSTPLFDPA